MALETQNRLVASMLVYLDGSVPISDQLNARSSNGILRKVAEFGTSFSPVDVAATWELEHPVTNDEAIVWSPWLPTIGAPGNVPIMVWIAPFTQECPGFPPELAAIPKNLLVLWTFIVPADYKGRAAITVFGLPTTVAPIPGEPLP